MSMVCDNPMLNNKTNRLAPSSGVLANSTTAPETLPVCKPLQGKEVCCQGPAWNELKANYEKIKTRFKTFVKKRKGRIEQIEKDLSEDLVEEVSDLLNDNQAMVKTDAFKLEYQRLQASGKKTKGGKDIKVSPIQKKKFDDKGFEVCKGMDKEECKKRLEKEKEWEKKKEDEMKKRKEEWEKKREEWEKKKEDWEKKHNDTKKPQPPKPDNRTDNRTDPKPDNRTDPKPDNRTDPNKPGPNKPGNKRFLSVLRSLKSAEEERIDRYRKE